MSLLCRPEYYKEVIEARKGIMTKADFTKIRRCLHPDWVQDVERKPVYETAFHLFTKLEKLLLNEKDSPTTFTTMPKTSLNSWNFGARRQRRGRPSGQSERQEVFAADNAKALGSLVSSREYPHRSLARIWRSEHPRSRSASVMRSVVSAPALEA